jgi:hypothetical protein
MEEPTFCWKDTTTRGIGTIPQACEANQDRIGLFCYPKCPSGYSRFGFDCHSNCPKGWRNDGLYCRNAEYGRGGGYPWKFGDGLNDNGMFDRCGRDNGGRQNCEKNGLIVYPKCKAGFYAVGCCICRPATPNCAKLGLGYQVDLSCEKKIIIGAPVTGTCKPGEDKNVGLCYPACKAGYTGIGPVCWGQPPKGWVNCGMGAAKDSKTCEEIIFNQVSSVGSLALNIASLGSSGAATNAGGSALKAKKIAEAVNKAKDFYEKNKKIIDKAKNGYEIAGKIQEMSEIAQKVGALDNQTTAEDVLRIAAETAALVDPSGVSGVIAAYSYAKCSKYFRE